MKVSVQSQDFLKARSPTAIAMDIAFTPISASSTRHLFFFDGAQYAVANLGYLEDAILKIYPEAWP